MNEKRAYHITLTGTVQGVSLRVTLKRFAHELGVTGYVQNEKNGTVTVVVEGHDFQLTQFINFCKQGSSFSRIEAIEVQAIEPFGYTEFTIIKNR